MPTLDEKNLALNKLMGWAPNRKCNKLQATASGGGPIGYYCLEHRTNLPHNIPPFNFYADTPEARERTRLLAIEYSRRTGRDVDIHIRTKKGCHPLFGAWAGGKENRSEKGHYGCGLNWSHAILDAIYEAIE